MFETASTARETTPWSRDVVRRFVVAVLSFAGLRAVVFFRAAAFGDFAAEVLRVVLFEAGDRELFPAVDFVRFALVERALALAERSVAVLPFAFDEAPVLREDEPPLFRVEDALLRFEVAARDAELRPPELFFADLPLDLLREEAALLPRPVDLKLFFELEEREDDEVFFGLPLLPLLERDEREPDDFFVVAIGVFPPNCFGVFLHDQHLAKVVPILFVYRVETFGSTTC
jgi:hypothetical protein